MVDPIREGLGRRLRQLACRSTQTLDTKQATAPLAAIRCAERRRARVEIEEFMVVPVGAGSLSKAVRWGGECFAALREVLDAEGYRIVVGDHGGFAPDLRDSVEAIELMLEAVRSAGFRAGREVVLALDAAATGFYDGQTYRSPAKKGGEHVLG
jgi:enolase